MALPRLAIGLISFGPGRPLAESLAACARHGIRHVGLTRELVASPGPAEVARILAGEGIAVTGYARAPRIPPTTGPERAQALSEGRRLLDEAATVGARHLIATGGGFDPAVTTLERAWDAFLEGMHALLPDAAACGVEIVIEPLHPMYAGDRGLVFTLARAVEACDVLGLERGLVVDAYHVWWEPGLAEALAAARGRIAEFHICDWRLPTRGPTDRAMIGEGCIDLTGLARRVRAAGFDGPYELELFSSQDWWLRSPDELLTTATRNFAALFAESEDA
ncbi:sugar phosphate isomerase/epimerase family protein [Frigidibacter oleivorans]|uniref:sugar phosphate isomerase/epimerase family protein n=1 Tax=Frigidibacter oleivorans TaxID=2487129 RepID=UPI0013DEDB22|nr:sugar phosphate isomerase/epimerase family protein [Frigidibacter oleivorans]